MTPDVALTRVHARRLREVYRSAGWPFQDAIEIALLAAGLLERVTASSGHEIVRVTDAGLAYLAQVLQGHRRAFSALEALVDSVARTMAREGRVVWTGLSLRAWIPPQANVAGRWRISRHDVFSIRNSSVQAYLEPIVHEIKVSRADLLGDLKRADKRAAYLEVGGQCWYALGCDAKRRSIGEPDEVPKECGGMICQGEQLTVARAAPNRPSRELPFGVWMALAKAAPMRFLEDDHRRRPVDGVDLLDWARVCVHAGRWPTSSPLWAEPYPQPSSRPTQS